MNIIFDKTIHVLKFVVTFVIKITFFLHDIFNQFNIHCFNGMTSYEFLITNKTLVVVKL